MIEDVLVWNGRAAEPAPSKREEFVGAGDSNPGDRRVLRQPTRSYVVDARLAQADTARISIDALRYGAMFWLRRTKLVGS